MEPDNYLRSTVDLVGQISSRYLELGARLYKIREEKLYLASYETFYDFLYHADIKPDTCSKLTKVHENFIVKGHVAPEQISNIGYTF